MRQTAIPLKKKPKLDAISLFTGSGGLDLGIEKAGFDVRVCVEKESDRIDTLKNNQPTAKGKN